MMSVKVLDPFWTFLVEGAVAGSAGKARAGDYAVLGIALSAHCSNRWRVSKMCGLTD